MLQAARKMTANTTRGIPRNMAVRDMVVTVPSDISEVYTFRENPQLAPRALYRFLGNRSLTVAGWVVRRFGLTHYPQISSTRCSPRLCCESPACHRVELRPPLPRSTHCPVRAQPRQTGCR